MKHEVDLKKYNLRTDLVIENNDNYMNQEVSDNDDVKVTTINLNKDEASLINKKEGLYITIEFNDITDTSNKEKVQSILIDNLKKVIKEEYNSCLVVGLGNISSTPDSLGPKVINEITVTRHIYLLNSLDPDYRVISALIPGVMGNTGIETSELIKSTINSVKPDFMIVIDALASSSIDRVNKTIQITDTGINPGSGIGNNRCEISSTTMDIPVIAIGVPTVVDASTVVADTIKYMHKNYAFNKKYLNSPMSRLVSNTKINYLKENIDIKEEDKSYLLGLVGTLNEYEIKELINEVLTPIGYNLIVTPKEIDFEIKKLTEIISNSINNALKKLS